MATISRRTMIRGLALAGTTVLVTDFATQSRTASTEVSEDWEEGRRYSQWRIDNTMWGMVIDLAKCDGCVDLAVPRCTSACQTGHYSPGSQPGRR